MQSKVNYDTAVIEIQRMRDEVLPMDKLNCLVACAHAVHNEKAGCEITGDDLMSIVIWILIRGNSSLLYQHATSNAPKSAAKHGILTFRQK